MLKGVKQFIKNHHDRNNAVDYLANHISYHLMRNCKLSKDAFVMFGQEQLRFLVASTTSDCTPKQINKIIQLALKSVMVTAKANYMITRNVIYIALL